MTTPSNPQAAAEAVAFDAVLTPHRSLGPLGLALLMGFFASLSLAIGIGFAIIGAWPVIGFFGLDVGLLWLAFSLNNRDGRLSEHLRLSARLFTVRRLLPSGRVREWRFQPYWLRVEMDDPPRHDSQLTLTSHGRRPARHPRHPRPLAVKGRRRGHPGHRIGRVKPSTRGGLRVASSVTALP